MYPKDPTKREAYFLNISAKSKNRVYTEEICKNHSKGVKAYYAKKAAQLPYLKKCRFCGKEAKTIEELEFFPKRKDCLYGRDSRCRICFNKMTRKGGKYYTKRVVKNPKDYRTPLQKRAQAQAETVPLLKYCELCPDDDIQLATERHHFDYTYPKLFVSVCIECHRNIDHVDTNKNQTTRWRSATRRSVQKYRVAKHKKKPVQPKKEATV